MNATEPPELSPRRQEEIVRLCRMLGDPSRVRILHMLTLDRELNVTQLCERLGQSQPAVSHHLKLLRLSGLVEPRRDGKHNLYSVRKQHSGIVQLLFETTITEPEVRSSPASAKSDRLALQMAAVG